jgi:hypothetical protein
MMCGVSVARRRWWLTVGRDQHPAERARARQSVHDAASVEAWWAAERHAAAASESRERLYRTATTCLVVGTVVLCVASLVAAFRV